MNASVIIKGTVYTDPFGIPWLKHRFPVNQTVDLSGVQTQENLSVGPLVIGASLEDSGDEVDLDLKVGLMGLPGTALYDHKFPLATHVSSGVNTIKIGGGQLEFDGTIQVINNTA
jgi:hypothetical protein